MESLDGGRKEGAVLNLRQVPESERWRDDKSHLVNLISGAISPASSDLDGGGEGGASIWNGALFIAL